MTGRVTIPATIEEVVGRLNGLDQLLTAKRWERAAIVFAFTRNDDKGGGAPGVREHRSNSRPVLGIKEFARLDIAGLTTFDTVARYRNAWASTGRPSAPGTEVDLDGLPAWPPDLANGGWAVKDPGRRDAIREQAELDGVGASKALDVASNPKAMAAAIKADPKVAAAARDALDTAYAAQPKRDLPGPVGSVPMDLVYEFSRLHRSVDSIITLVINGKAVISDAQRDAVLREVEWLHTALGYIKDGIRGDSLDKALADLMDAEA